MQDATLLRGALFIGITGVLALFILDQHLTPELTTATEWSDQTKQVKTQGYVEKHSFSKNQTYLVLNQTCQVQVQLPKKAFIELGQLVEVKGDYEYFQGRGRIQAKEIHSLG